MSSRCFTSTFGHHRTKMKIRAVWFSVHIEPDLFTVWKFRRLAVERSCKHNQNIKRSSVNKVFGQIFQPVENSSSAMWTQPKRRKEEKSYQAPLRASSFLLSSFFTRRKEYQFNKLVPGYYPYEIQIQFIVCFFFTNLLITGLGLGQTHPRRPRSS